VTLSAKEELPAHFVLRLKDEAECRAAGFTGTEAIKFSAAHSSQFWTVYLNEQPIVVWGYAAESLFSYRCRAWLLSSAIVENHKVLFVRESVKALRFLFGLYEEVEVYVHNEYADAIAWLTWLGFTPIAHSDNFTFMLASRVKSRWVS
jgi:hypothetical protein